ncbi:MAG: response regulator [Elusimicrobiales bacterium]
MAVKILIVEDEQDLATLLRFIFEKFGYAVMEAHNGQEALDLIDSVAEPPDVIVTDVMMPVLDGYSMVTQLQENPVTRKIPVIIITAKGQTKELFQIANVVGFIEKPFEPKHLKELVDKLVAKK